jgi:hypothetical protein
MVRHGVRRLEIKREENNVRNSRVAKARLTLVLASCFSFLCCARTSFSQEVTAKASADKPQYLVGDYINYTISVYCPKGFKIYPPALIPDSLQNISIIQKGKPEEEEKDGRVEVSFKYILSGYDSAEVTIPPIAVPYQAAQDSTTQTASTNTVSFVVQTLKVNPQAEIMDVKPPMKILLNWKLIIFWTLVALFVVGVPGYSYLLRRKARVKPIPSEKILPPHAIALNALHDLEKQKLWQKGMIKEYHSAITEIVRRYFEQRFNMPAMELPTSEAMKLLGENREGEPILGTTYDFLSNADLVKFAKFTPLDSVNEEMMKQAYEIVNKTIPVAEPRTENSEELLREADRAQVLIRRDERQDTRRRTD